jgi:hypothetical protein
MTDRPEKIDEFYLDNGDRVLVVPCLILREGNAKEYTFDYVILAPYIGWKNASVDDGSFALVKHELYELGKFFDYKVLGTGVYYPFYGGLVGEEED